MSVIIVKTKDGTVKAFHNVCRHRGNKLVWNDFPTEETSGTCRQFTCKYHAWRYDLAGDLTFVQQEGEFFDLDKADYGLKEVACDVWEGFIFVNLNPQQTLTEYLGKMAEGLEGYPFHEMTEVYSYKAEVGSNWKLFIDAFAEFYHAPVLHQKQAVKNEADKLISYGFEALHYEIHDPHSMISSWGGMAPPKDPSWSSPSNAPSAAASSARGTGLASKASIPCPPVSSPPVTTPGEPTPSSSSPTSCFSSGLPVGTSPTTTGPPPSAATSSRPAFTSCRRRTPATASLRSCPLSPSRNTRSRTPTPLKRPRP